jgi:DNA-binding NtrC family response regulator
MDLPRVLVVEDRPSVLKLMATILANGYAVTAASDGAQALSLVGSAPFEVVLTDIQMPGVTGFDVLRAVQSRAPRASVVMMTAYANVTDAVSAIKLGAYDYIAKPVDADEVSLVVARAVAHHQDEVAAPGLASACGAVDDGTGQDDDLPVCFHQAVEDARDRASHRYLVRLMQVFHGNVTLAAKRAGMTRESLHRVLRKYGVRSEPYKEHAGDGACLAEYGDR